MAIYKPGPIVSDIRGSIGGTTFGRNRAGLFARRRVSPTNPNTPLQQEIRSQFAVSTNNWRTLLTQAQRDGWNDLGTTTIFKNAIGEDYNPSGIQLYVRTSMMQQVTDQPLVTTAPPTAVYALGDWLVEYLVLTGIVVTSATGETAEPGFFSVQISLPLSAGISFYKGPFRQHAVYDNDDFTIFPFTLVLLASLSPSSRYFLRIRGALDTGEVSDSPIFVIDTPASL